MGSWNQTCALSNLPIQAGDEVGFIVLKYKGEHELGGGGTCYPTDLYQPVTPVLKGVYDDYGNVEDIEDSIFIQLFLDHINQNMKLNGVDHVVLEEGRFHQHVEKFDSLDELMDRIQEGDVYNSSTYVTSGKEFKYKYGYMMFHWSIYQDLLNELRQRQVYGGGTYQSRQNTAVIEFKRELDALTAHCLELEEHLATETNEELKKIYRDDLAFQKIFRPMCNSDLYRMLRNDNWHFELGYIGDHLFEHSEDVDEILPGIVDMQMLGYIMSLMRKMFIPQSGQGSQSTEYKLHLVLCDAIKHRFEIKKEEMEEYRDEDEPEWNGED